MSSYPNKFQAKVKTIIQKPDIDIKQRQRDMMTEKFFDKVIEELIQKIKFFSTTGTTDGIFKIPTERVGVPDFDYRTLLQYSINKLRELGFYVRYIPETSLYISWLDEKKVAKDAEIQKFLEHEKKLTKEFILKHT